MGLSAQLQTQQESALGLITNVTLRPNDLVAAGVEAIERNVIELATSDLPKEIAAIAHGDRRSDNRLADNFPPILETLTGGHPCGGTAIKPGGRYGGRR